jgi:hypothetical protein
MRNRIIRATFWLNEELADCEAYTRLLFIGLWGFADREGLFEWREKQIKASLFPYDNIKIDPHLSKLLSKNFIRKYEVDGKFYGQIINFLKHQSIHKHEASSQIPMPPTVDVDTCRDITSSVCTLEPWVRSNSNSNSNISIEDSDPKMPLKLPDGTDTKHVRITKEQSNKLKDRYREELDIHNWMDYLKKAIEKLDSYLERNSKKRKEYKDHYLVFLDWVLTDTKKKVQEDISYKRDIKIKGNN